jgi:SAM-dependent methyltransferase
MPTPPYWNSHKELPFNYGDDVEAHARRIIEHDLGASYPPLAALVPGSKQVLEVGCGVGWLSCGIARQWEVGVSGIDFNPVVIERARTIAKHMKLPVQFEVADLFTYEVPRPADLVVSLGVLHHTDNCAEAVRRCMTRFTAPGGHFVLGLYHTYGRRPFLQHFADMKDAGASEEAMLQEYGRLHHWLSDRKHLYSWFRDQVLHPHETQHTLQEMVAIGRECGHDLISTSINRFGPVDDLDAIFQQEAGYEDISRERLKQGVYFPGFFIAVFKRR